jgi:hypothetical protein
VKIPFTAPPRVNDALLSLGQTEDVCFSPNNRRLAVVGFATNRIAVFDIDITSTSGGTGIALTGGVLLTSSALQMPHGLDFIDDDVVIVANRQADMATFALPAGDAALSTREVSPLQTWSTGASGASNSPGAVSIVRDVDGIREVLVCNTPYLCALSAKRTVEHHRAWTVLRSDPRKDAL